MKFAASPNSTTSRMNERKVKIDFLKDAEENPPDE